VNVFSKVFAPFCFYVFAVPVLLWDTQNWASKRVSAALGPLPAIAVVVFRLRNGTRGWHGQCNKSKQAQLNRQWQIWVTSQFLEELLKKEAHSSRASEHFDIIWKANIKHPVQLALVVEITGIYLLCHRIIIPHKSPLFLINACSISIPASHSSYFFFSKPWKHMPSF